jgi:spermidine synthase
MTNGSASPDPREFFCEWLTAGSGAVFRFERKLEDFRTAYQHLEVYETKEYGRLFRLDGCNMTSERDEFLYHENIVHVGLLAQDRPRRAFIVGGGDGGAAEEILKHPSIERVVLAELDPEVVRIARQYFQSVHRGALDDARVDIRIGDAYDAMRRTNERFDLVVMDLTDPIGPAEALYTAPFFREAERVREPAGVLALHIGAPFFHGERFAATTRELASVFAFVRLYFVYVPLYGASWGMAFASQRTDVAAMSARDIDERIRVRGIAQLQYVTGDTMHGGFALPPYVASILERGPSSPQP